jgi:hypothetical protein
MKIRLLLAIFLFPLFALSQNAIIKGTLLDNNNQPLSNTPVQLKGTAFQTQTDNDGSFTFKDIPFGDYSLEIPNDIYGNFSQDIKADKAEIDLDKITVQANEDIKSKTDEIPTVSITDEDVKDASSQNVSAVLNASRDVFVSTASYTFGAARFRIRGYENGNDITLMNAAPMINLENGRTLYNDWSGLNDVLHNQDVSYGLAPATFSYGGIGGAYSIDSRASHQRKQLQASYALSNRSYDDRFMLTYGTGILSNGWSFALSGSRRWSTEGYVPGTYYDGWSYFASAEKIINNNHSISLTIFGAPTINGRSKPATQELYDLAGSHYYNPNWGYQNGKKRNAVVGDRSQPVFILNHDWKINNLSSLQSAISYQFGKDKVSGLEWYNAPDPRPDYYRNLPSYVDGSVASQSQADNLFSNNESVRQINWDKLYETNSFNIDTVYDANGIKGSKVGGKRSLYILRNRVRDNQIFNFNTIYNKVVTDHFAITAGLTYQTQSTDNYAEVKDLLGGSFYVDQNKYADTSTVNAGNNNAIQNDLNHPNRVLHVGDKFGYNYTSHISMVSDFFQTMFKFNKVDFFFGMNLSGTSFYRTGNYRNGIFPDDSYGDSQINNFLNYAFKGGITYKYNGKNYFYINGATLSKAPYFDDVYISPITRNSVADNIVNEHIQSIEGGYLLRSPKLKVRATAYYTQFTNGTKTERFFLEGNNSTFVNFTMTGIDKTHVGIELAADANLGMGFGATAVASIGQYYYSSRPVATATQDNSDTTLFKNETIYIKNLRVAGSPQSAYSLGLNYRSKKFWHLNVNFNYFDNIYIDYSPARRRLAALDKVDQDSPLWNEILGQEKEKGQFTMDISGGWSWKVNNKFKSLKRNTFLVLNLGVTNITNNKDLVVTGYEYTRIDPQGQQTDLAKFPPRYSYGYGTTFFVSLLLRMN